MTERAAAGRFALLLGLSSLLIFTAARRALPQAPPAVVKAHMALKTDAVHAGSPAQASVMAEIAPGYHINDHHPTLDYLIPTVLKFDPARGFKFEKITYPQGRVRKFIFAESGLSVYEGNIVIQTALKVAPDVAPGEYNVRGKLEYQACNDHACLPPASVPLSLRVKVVSRNVPIRHVDSNVPGKARSE